MNNDTRNAVLVFLSISVTLIVILGGSYLYLNGFEGLFNKEPNTTKTTIPKKKIVTDSEIAVSLDNDNVKNIIGILGNNNYSNKYYDYFYKEDDTDATNLEIEFRIWLVLKKLGLGNKINENQVREGYRNIFGNVRGYKVVKDLNNCYNYTYSGNTYTFMGNTCDYETDIITRPAYARNRTGKDVDVLDLYEYVIFTKVEDGIYKYYSDYKKENLILESSVDLGETIMDTNYSEAGLYKYIFIKNRDKIYEFDSVEKVK